MKKCLFSLLIYFVFSLAAFSADYYWVGGSGNWNDINHWRTSSGGTILPSVVPGPTDDVYFDANAGFIRGSNTVYVNVIANCRDITFDGSSVAPILTGGSQLNIYGSSVWQTGMTNSVYNINYENTGTPKTIKSNGVRTGGSNRVVFNETTSINLLDDFSTGGILILGAGTWNTNNFRVDTRSDMSINAGVTVNLGSSDMYIGEGFYISSSSITLNAGTSHIHLLGSDNLSDIGGHVFYNVTFENFSTYQYIYGNNSTFNRVEFKGDGAINGNNTFNELILASGKTYNFSSNSTQTIKKRLSAGTACKGWTTIQSIDNGRKATLSMPAGATVDVTGVILKDMTATGGADFTANSSVDNGGNSGWTFPAAAVKDLYWVGGAGYWDDPAHWAITSGGTGGACVPGPNDNVLFDANSGFTTDSKSITLNSDSYCRDITFAGADTPPTITSRKKLNIYGSSVWQAGMTNSLSDINYQDTGTPKTIKSNGVKNGIGGNNRINFNETTSISLLDDFSITEGGSLYLNAGTWNTNNFRVDISSRLEGNEGSTANLGSSDIYLNGDFSATSNKFTLNAGTSHIHLTNAFARLIGQGQTFYNVSFENPNATGTINGYPKMGLTFNRVEFAGNGDIIETNKFNELILASAKTYSFGNNSTQTIKKRLSAGTACAGWTTIQSNVSGGKATLSMPAGATVDVTGVILKDMTATGGADFTANSSIDNGGNSGWTFPAAVVKNLYWVGGAGNWNDAAHWATTSGGTGGACVPGPNDNVFFDINSGFTSRSKIVTVNSASYCRDITFDGAETPPTITSTKITFPLNIYGSSVWQTGMTNSINWIYYENTGTPKTIKSNGVITGGNSGPSTVRFNETSSISLLDNFSVGGTLTLIGGTWNTNNFRVDIGNNMVANQTRTACTINLGSSDIYIRSGSFITNTSLAKVNAGTSHIHLLSTTSSVSGYADQVFYDISFNNPMGSNTIQVYPNATYKLTFNRVEFKGGGTLNGNFTFEELTLLSKNGYTLKDGTTQTINKNLIMSGTPCDVLPIRSSLSGTQANLKVLAGNTDFNFVNMKDINASGSTLHFGKQSTIANQNNTNVTFDPYDPGSIDGLGPDWLCHTIDDKDSKSYTLSAAGFFGNKYTKYVWTKLDDPDHTGVIGTDISIDLRSFGYGKYKVDVTYTNGADELCKISGQIEIKPKTEPIQVVNPFKICAKETTTLISDVTGINGENIKWYATSTATAALPDNTALIDGTTYYVTQTIDGCESLRTAITVSLVKCNKAIYINPNIRLRVESNN